MAQESNYSILSLVMRKESQFVRINKEAPDRAICIIDINVDGEGMRIAALRHSEADGIRLDLKAHATYLDIRTGQELCAFAFDESSLRSNSIFVHQIADHSSDIYGDNVVVPECGCYVLIKRFGLFTDVSTNPQDRWVGKLLSYFEQIHLSIGRCDLEHAIVHEEANLFGEINKAEGCIVGGVQSLYLL